MFMAAISSGFTINNINFNEKWDEKFYPSMVDAIQKLPKPTFHANQFIPPERHIIFAEQRTGVFTTDGKLSADFFATHGTSQCLLIYMYTKSFDRLFIHLDNKPCNLESPLARFKERKINIVIVGGSLEQDIDFEAILKPFLQRLYQISQEENFSFHFVEQMILNDNQFDESQDTDSYAIDFILRKANFISKQIFHEMLPAHVVEECFDMKEKGAPVKPVPMDLMTFLPVLQNAHPIVINAETKGVLELSQHPLEEVKRRFYAKLTSVFDQDILQMFKRVLIGNAGLSSFTFPKTRMRHVGVELKTGEWYACSEVMDQRSNRYIRALRLLDFSWPDMPHIFDSSNNSLDQVVLHPNLSILPKKIMETLKLHFQANLDGLYNPGMIDFMKKIFKFNEIGLSHTTVTYSLEGFINFIQINYAKDAECLSEVSFTDQSRLPNPAQPIRTEENPGYLFRKYANEGALEQMKELFKRTKVDVNVAGSPSGQNALHRAARNGHVPCVQFLLSHDAEINITDKDDKTPLHMAIFYGYEEIVLMLLEKKPAKNPKIPYGILKRKDKDDLDVDKLLAES